MPIATFAVSCQWAAAVNSESTALQLALALLHATSNVCAASFSDILSLEGLGWITGANLTAALASPVLVRAHAFARQVSLPVLLPHFQSSGAEGP